MQGNSPTQSSGCRCREDLCPWQLCLENPLSVEASLDPILALFVADVGGPSTADITTATVVGTPELRRELWRRAWEYVRQEQKVFAEEVVETNRNGSASSCCSWACCSCCGADVLNADSDSTGINRCSGVVGFLQFRSVVDLLDSVGVLGACQLVYEKVLNNEDFREGCSVANQEQRDSLTLRQSPTHYPFCDPCRTVADWFASCMGAETEDRGDNQNSAGTTTSSGRGGTSPYHRMLEQGRARAAGGNNNNSQRQRIPSTSCPTTCEQLGDALEHGCVSSCDYCEQTFGPCANFLCCALVPAVVSVAADAGCGYGCAWVMGAGCCCFYLAMVRPTLMTPS
eukprot:g16888.t1